MGSAKSLSFAAAATLALASPSLAAIVTNTSAAFPTSPNVATVDANNTTTPANRGINTTRDNRQTFSVTAGVTVEKIYLSATNYNDLAFTLQFFPTNNVQATSGTGSVATPVAGSQIGGTITVSPTGAGAVTGAINLEITLTAAEQFTLAAADAPAGYFVSIKPADTTNATSAFNWVHTNSGVDQYAGGRYRRDGGEVTATRDYGLALVGSVPVPEPATVTTFAAVGLLALRRRR